MKKTVEGRKARWDEGQKLGLEITDKEMPFLAKPTKRKLLLL